MHPHFLDPYHLRSSPAHRLDSRVKLVLALATILSLGLLPVGFWPAYAAIWLLIWLAQRSSALPASFYWKRSLLALPFILAALPLLFTYGPPYAVLPAGIAVSLPGTERFFSLAVKSWLSVQAALWLATTTHFPDLLGALRALRVPRLLVAIFSLMWRYLFVLVDEAYRLNRARSARSGSLSSRQVGGRLAWRARVTGSMVGSLTLRSFDRADAIYAAMLSRGYDGEVRLLPQPPPAADDWWALGGILALLAALVLAGLLWG